MKLAKRVGRIKPSPTLAITAKANALRAEGRDVLSFGAGEPDFDTPRNIKEAAIEAIKSGFTKYTPVGGINELKRAIIEKFQKDNNLDFVESQVVVSCGAKHSLYNIAQALFEEGDEVIIPAPYWVSYPDIVLLTDAAPVIVETEESHGFKLKPSQLEKVLTTRTKGLILNSPSNPTGAVYTRAELEALAAVVGDRDMIIISDDIYEKVMYGDTPFVNIANVNDAVKKKTIVVNGVSKSHSMTGWRIGYAAGDEKIISQVAKIQSQNTSNPTSISQKAALEALLGSQEETAKMVAEFQKRRDYIVQALNDIDGITCMMPQGAFYVFPNISSIYGCSYGNMTIEDSTGYASYLLDEANVAVVPGIAFGSDSHIRLSYATSMANIEKGITRIKEATERLA